MVRAVIYCRCSTEEESQQEALKKQVIEAKESVKANGWQLADEYIESKSGTTSGKRKEYQRLFGELLTDKFDVVLIKSQDRLMRNAKDWYLFIDRLVTNGKRLYIYMERKFYTPDDALITGIKAILAEEYSKELSKKINNAHKNRQRRGESFIFPPGTYGYQKLPDKSIAVLEEEAKAIRLMFHLCRTMGCMRIASILEKEGYCDRNGRFFQEEAIRRIIRNPIRCGTVVQNKRHFDFRLKQELKMPEEEWIVHKEAVPAIVTEGLWREANMAMDKRAGIYHKTSGTCHKTANNAGAGGGKFDLSGKIHCGLCGGNYYRTYRKRFKDHSSIVEWKCQNYLRYGRNDARKARPGIRKASRPDGKGCDNIHLDEQRLLNVLEKSCAAYHQNYGMDYQEIIEQVLSALKKIFNGTGPTGKIKERQQRIQKQEMLSEKLMDKLLNATISDEDYKRKKETLDEMIQKLKEEIKMYEQPEKIQAKTENEMIRKPGLEALHPEGGTRIQKIEERVKKDILRRAVLSDMIENIESIEVFEKRLRLQFYAEPLFQHAFVQEIYFDEEFVYALEKEAERNRIIEYMGENPYITAKGIADLEQISLTAVNYRIKKLRQQGKIHFDGKGGHGKWKVNKM